MIVHLSALTLLVGISTAAIGDVCRSSQGSGTCKSVQSCSTGTLGFQSLLTHTHTNAESLQASPSLARAPTTLQLSNAASKQHAKTTPANVSTSHVTPATAASSKPVSARETVMSNAVKKPRQHYPQTQPTHSSITSAVSTSWLSSTAATAPPISL